jgi:amino acid permease
LEISGPGGTLLAIVIVGIIAIAVMEGVSELVQCFPAPNAIAEYVTTFVDPDLGWVCGIAYL